MRLNQYLNAAKLETRISQPLTTILGRFLKNGKSEDASVFPNSSFHGIRDTALVYSLSIVPVSEEKTSIRYDLFSSQGENNSNAGDVSTNLKNLLNEAIGILEREYQNRVNGSGYVSSTSTISPS